LLPVRSPPLTDIKPRIFEARLCIRDGGAADGKTLADALALTKGEMRISKVERGGLLVMKLPSVQLRDGDLLHVRDTPDRLKEFERILGATLLVEVPGAFSGSGLARESDQQLAEAVVTQGSRLELRSLGSSHFLAAHGIVPLALHRPGRTAEEPAGTMSSTKLRSGDVILLQGSESEIDRLRRSGQLLVLDGKIDVPRRRKASLALTIMGGVVVLAALGVLPIAIAAFLGVGMLLAARCLTWTELRAAIDLRIILVIVASLALGLMLMATGAAEYLAGLYVSVTGDLPVILVLSGLMLIMALLTEVATNNAIAVLGTPIAISIAARLGAPAEPFVLAVLYGANMSYLTPVGYQTNLLVMSAGGYRFSDFLRVGIPLQLIMWLGLSAALPLFYDL
jgi:di/tricarboxylate transporter